MTQQLTKLIFMLLTAVGIAGAQQKILPAGTSPPAPPLKLTSAAFSDSAAFARKYTCVAEPNIIKRGPGKSPPLEWSDVPEGTASFVLIFHDLEPRLKKSSEDYVHWMVWNLPADARQLPEGVAPTPELPDGARQGYNDGGQIGYRVPCPPPGNLHHYVFELFAVDKMLNVAPVATRADVLKVIDGHVLGHAVLIGLLRLPQSVQKEWNAAAKP